MSQEFPSTPLSEVFLQKIAEVKQIVDGVRRNEAPLEDAQRALQELQAFLDTNAASLDITASNQLFDIEEAVRELEEQQGSTKTETTVETTGEPIRGIGEEETQDNLQRDEKGVVDEEEDEPVVAESPQESPERQKEETSSQQGKYDEFMDKLLQLLLIPISTNNRVVLTKGYTQLLKSFFQENKAGWTPEMRKDVLDLFKQVKERLETAKPLNDDEGVVIDIPTQASSFNQFIDSTNALVEGIRNQISDENNTLTDIELAELTSNIINIKTQLEKRITNIRDIISDFNITTNSPSENRQMRLIRQQLEELIDHPRVIELQEKIEELIRLMNPETEQQNYEEVSEEPPHEFSEDQVRHSHAFRDFAVLQKWIPTNSPDRITDQETIRMIETKFIETLLHEVSVDYWNRATDKEVKPVDVTGFPVVRRASQSVSVGDVLQTHPDSSLKNTFELQLEAISKLLNAGFEWGKIETSANFEQLREYAKECLPGQKMLTAITRMRSSEQLENPEALSTGQLIFEGFYHYSNWGNDYIELSRQEVEDIRQQVLSEIASNSLRLPSLQQMRMIDRKDSDAKAILRDVSSEASDVQYVKLLWRKTRYDGDIELSEQDHYERFREDMVNLVVSSRREKEQLDRHTRYGIWPLMIVDAEQRKRYREEIAKAIGVRKLSHGTAMYIPRVSEIVGPDAGLIVDEEGIPLAMSDEQKSEFLDDALKIGKPYELMAYDMAIAYFEPTIQDYTGQQSNRGTRVFNSLLYRKRKKQDGSEGEYFPGILELHRVMLPPAVYMNARVPHNLLGRSGGIRLRAFAGQPEMIQHASFNKAFDLISDEGEGQRLKYLDAFTHMENLYNALAGGFNAAGINILNIAEIRGERGFFSTQKELVLNDEILRKLTDFITKTLKYWVGDYYKRERRGETRLRDEGLDTEVWKPYEIGDYVYYTPLLDEIFNFSDDKKAEIIRKAEDVGLESAVVTEIIRLIFIESLVRLRVRHLSNENAWSIVYALTGENRLRYKVAKSEVHGALHNVLDFSVEDAAYCFQEAGVSVPHELVQAFRRGGGI